jgi:DNA-binding MarR family transcriptional regulator
LVWSILKEMLNLTDGNLGAHLKKLEEAGYIRIEKTFINNKPYTYVAATERGKPIMCCRGEGGEERRHPGPASWIDVCEGR